MLISVAHLLLGPIQRLLDPFGEESGSSLEVRPDFVLCHRESPIDLSLSPRNERDQPARPVLLCFLSNPPHC